MARASAGDIVLTTGLDNSKLAKELDKLEKELYDKQIDLNITNIDYESAKRQLDNYNKALEENKAKLEKLNQKKQEQNALLEQAKATGEPTDFLYSTLSAITEEQTKILDENIKILDNWNKQFDAVDKIELKLQKQNNDIEDTENKIENVKNQITEASNIDLSNNMNKANSSLDKIAKSVSHLGLRLLGINSLYGMISQSVNRVQDQNPQFANFMQAIQNMLDVVISKLMTMIEPFLPRILPMIETVLTLIFKIAEALDKTLGPIIDAIIKAIEWIIDAFGWLIDGLLSLLGIDVSHETEKFAKDINEASKGLKGTNKEVSKLRKQLLGFDEMNVLNSETGSVGALGTTLTGTKNNTKEQIDDNTKALKEFEDELDKFDYKFIGGFSQKAGVIGGGINITKTGEELVKYAQQFNEFYDTARSISEKNGMVTIVGKTGETIQITRKELDGLIEDLNNKVISKKNLTSWQKIQKVFKDINVKRYSITQKAIAQGFKDATIEYKDGLVNVRLATGETITYTEEEFNKLIPYIKQVSDYITTTTDDTIDHINTEIGGVNGVVTGAINDITLGAQEGANGVLNATNEVKGAIDVAYAGINAQSNKSANNTKTGWLNSAQEIINKFTPNTKEAVNGAVTGALLGIENTSETTSENTRKNMVDKMKDAIEEMKRLINYWTPGTKTIKFKADTTELTKGIEGAVQGVFITLGIGHTSGGRKGAKGLLIGPHLASGGIINRPGRGVPLAVGGIVAERGREAVLPLTDSQQMAYLGREIAKNIVVNLTNITELDGRQIAIATSKAINEMNFASNGGVI